MIIALHTADQAYFVS